MLPDAGRAEGLPHLVGGLGDLRPAIRARRPLAPRVDLIEDRQGAEAGPDRLVGLAVQYRHAMEKSVGKLGPAVAQRMRHWLQDEDFAGVRGPEALGKLPEDERQEWQKLWQEVEALRQSATRQPAAASSARP
jgi:hypothetical protein